MREFKLEKVIPWGHSRQEYVKMFGLTPDEHRCPMSFKKVAISYCEYVDC